MHGISKNIIILSALFLAACGATAQTEYDAQGHKLEKISCIRDVNTCYAKATKICPGGYNKVKEDPAIGTGNYYQDGYTAREVMAYNVTVSCK